MMCVNTISMQVNIINMDKDDIFLCCLMKLFTDAITC